MTGIQKITNLFMAFVLIISLSACNHSSAPPPVVATDATLSSLTLSAGDISPAFASGTTNYTLTTASDSTTLTPTVNQTNATVTVNSVTVASGAASTSIALAVGDTSINVVVTAEDGSTAQTYMVTITRALAVSTDATLSGLTLSAGAISPVFSSNSTSYTVTTSDTSTTVTPMVNEANATVTVNDITVASGAASASIALAAGDTTINVVVTAEDGSTTQTYIATVTATVSSGLSSLELIDPTPRAGDNFGSRIVLLDNGNIVVSDPNDSSIEANSGAVHLYSPNSSTPIGSIYGDDENDQLGSNGIIALGNNNYVILSPNDDEDGIFDASSVRLINGTTGLQIGAALTGNTSGDQLGSDGLTVLSNNNYVVESGFDTENGIVNAGSVRLMDGATGVQIGPTLMGDVTGDFFGFGLGGIFVTELGNNNYVIATFLDDEGGVVDAGSVRLMNGSTGIQIGSTLAGDVEDDQLGREGVTALGNNNYVIRSPSDDEGGNVNVGSVRLVNGSTGVQIGTTLTGDVAGDRLGATVTVALENNNYVVSSPSDDENGIVNSGSVRLMNGTTGAQIGVTMSGDIANDQLGSGVPVALGNNNFVTSSRLDDEGGIVDAGAVRLMNGSTGTQIGITLSGDRADDFLGSTSIVALGNNNYVIASMEDDEGFLANAGSVRLVNGNTGVQISALTGDQSADFVGASLNALANNNYVISSYFDIVDGINQAGSVRLMNGTTGAQIGPILAGDAAGDRLGLTGITELDNNNYVVKSGADDEGGILNAGSVRLINGSTGVAIGAAIVGTVTGDMSLLRVIESSSGEGYILSQPFADKAGLVDSGMVRIVEP